MSILTEIDKNNLAVHIIRYADGYMQKNGAWQCIITGEKDGVKIEAKAIAHTHNDALSLAWDKFEPQGRHVMQPLIEHA